MLNKEKYAKEIAELAVNNEIIALKDNKPISCPEIKCDDCGRNSKSGCSRRILTEWANLEYKEDILTEKEKTYLKAVMEPFKDRVNHLRKHTRLGCGTEYVGFIIDDRTLLIDLPDFESGTKYKGMKLSKSYTPEELGL